MELVRQILAWWIIAACVTATAFSIIVTRIKKKGLDNE
jgi:hypothetical protein